MPPGCAKLIFLHTAKQGAEQWMDQSNNLRTIQYAIGGIHDSEMMKCHKARMIKGKKVSDIHCTGKTPHRECPSYNAAIPASTPPLPIYTCRANPDAPRRILRISLTQAIHLHLRSFSVRTTIQTRFFWVQPTFLHCEFHSAHIFFHVLAIELRSLCIRR